MNEHPAFPADLLNQSGINRQHVFNLDALPTEVSGSLNDFFETIITQGTAIKFQVEHNQQWLEHPRAIVEAFLHTKYFTEMMVKYGSSLETAPSWLPSGWAAILELYNQR